MSSLFSTPRALNWYFRLVMPSPRPQATAEQEQSFRSRAYLLAVVTTLLTLLMTLLLPATLFIPNHLALLFCFALWLFCLFCLFLNKRGKVLFTSYLLVGAFEVTLMAVILTTRPFDTFNLPLFDLFALADLLAITLLSWRAVVPLFLLNTLFIVCVVAFQPQSGNLHAFLQMPLSSLYPYNIVIRPISIQFAAIIIPLVWIQGSKLAWERARQAEIAAEMERSKIQEQLLLEQDIQQLLLLCLQGGTERSYQPQSQGHTLLLQAFLVLRERLGRVQQLEETHNHLVQAVQQASLCVLADRPIQSSGTLLDLLVLAWQKRSGADPGHLSQIADETRT